jgi:hypothetical protein
MVLPEPRFRYAAFRYWITPGYILICRESLATMRDGDQQLGRPAVAEHPPAVGEGSDPCGQSAGN